jgi:hypothetical protein
MAISYPISRDMAVADVRWLSSEDLILLTLGSSYPAAYYFGDSCGSP